MKILYISNHYECASARYMAVALRRLGHEVEYVSTKAALKCSRLSNAFHWRTGYRFASKRIMRWLGATVLCGKRYEAVWIHSGEEIGPASVRLLKKHSRYVINYNFDDPTGRRDGRRWDTLRAAIPMYDLCAIVRCESEMEYPGYGARRVVRVHRSADEFAHRPRPITAALEAKWGSEVVFVGTWMPERGPFLLELVQRGVPLSIRGSHWQKASEWPVLKEFWRGPAVDGDEYAYAIQCSKVALGLLSRGNRDLHTIRTAEIPSLGGVLCAQRTADHLALYKDGEEALYWANAAECADRTLALLSNPAMREIVAARGRARFLEGPMRNEAVGASVLNAAMGRLDQS